ncbi:MAG: hypothetical protein JSV29_04975 [Candidatus Bathyarchaeota archaeon]|nr:MAG: hypothetical protein JSV29_04975 [Candidatus Bathyarchaeota archaeon]
MEVIHIPFNCDSESPFIDIRKTYGFQITAFPPARPKYKSLKRRFKGDGLIFYENGQGVYHLEYYLGRMPSPIETKVILPHSWELQTRRCEITITYIGLGYKWNSRKEVFDFANAISSRMHACSWPHEIVWFADDHKRTKWKISKEK